MLKNNEEEFLHDNNEVWIKQYVTENTNSEERERNLNDLILDENLDLISFLSIDSKDPILPKPVPNAIDNIFAKMFMNTLNSGDFNHIQDFFKTFMIPQCKYIGAHIFNNTTTTINTRINSNRRFATIKSLFIRKFYTIP